MIRSFKVADVSTLPLTKMSHFCPHAKFFREKPKQKTVRKSPLFWKYLLLLDGISVEGRFSFGSLLEEVALEVILLGIDTCRCLQFVFLWKELLVSSFCS